MISALVTLWLANACVAGSRSACVIASRCQAHSCFVDVATLPKLPRSMR